MWMCATSPLPSSRPQPSDISLFPTIISAKLPQRLFSLTVSAQSPQPPPTQNDHPKASLVTQAAAKHQSSGPKTKTKTSEQPSSPLDSTGQERRLSGSDVLWALNRATAEKAKKKKKKKMAVSMTSRARRRGNGEDKAADYATIRPLTIKSDWSVRLDQLEERLRQLLGA